MNDELAGNGRGLLGAMNDNYLKSSGRTTFRRGGGLQFSDQFNSICPHPT